MKKLLLTLLLFPSLLQAATEERWYQVELLLFANNNSDYHESELWPLDYTEPQLEQSRELSKAGGSSSPQAFSLLPTEELKLGAAAARIKRASDVELVLHLGWLQPGLPENEAMAVHVYDGMLEEINHRGSKPKARHTEPDTAEKALPKLDGTLRLVLSRYLHLQSDLIWRDPLSAEEQALLSALPVTDKTSEPERVAESAGDEVNIASNGSNEVETGQTDMPSVTHHVYRMQQSRRMRSNEIHYLDHPRFGIIAQVTRYEPEQAEKEQAENQP